MDERLNETSSWLRERIDGRVAIGLAVTWLVLFQIAAALEPATDEPEPWFGVALELTFWVLVATMATGLVMQRRAGFLASLGAAGFLTALSVACPVSGHHPFGAWWYGQMACTLGLVVASVLALRTSSVATGSERDRRLHPVTERSESLAPAERTELE